MSHKAPQTDVGLSDAERTKPNLELVEIKTDTEPLVGLLYRPSELVSRDPENKGRCAVFFHGNTMNFYTGLCGFCPQGLWQ